MCINVIDRTTHGFHDHVYILVCFWVTPETEIDHVACY